MDADDLVLHDGDQQVSFRFQLARRKPYDSPRILNRTVQEISNPPYIHRSRIQMQFGVDGKQPAFTCDRLVEEHRRLERSSHSILNLHSHWIHHQRQYRLRLIRL